MIWLIASCVEDTLRLVVGDDYDYYEGETDYGDFYYIKDQLSRGRLEICVGRAFGAICAESWDSAAASVACRQLGFSPYGMLLKSRSLC